MCMPVVTCIHTCPEGPAGIRPRLPINPAAPQPLTPRAWPSSPRTTTTARPCGLHQPLTGPGASCSWPALAAAGQLQPGLCQRAPGPDADLAPGGTNTTSTTEAKATRRIAGTPRCETRSCSRGGPGQPRTAQDKPRASADEPRQTRKASGTTPVSLFSFRVNIHGVKA